MSIEQAIAIVIANIYFASVIDSNGFRWALGIINLGLSFYLGWGN